MEHDKDNNHSHNLTSRKLVAAIAGITALVVLTLLVGIYPDAADFAGKVVMWIGAITLGAVGAQAVIDQIRK